MLPHECEDHNHLLKRIAGMFTKGRTWMKAMNYAETGLTYTALTGKRKQSVVDADKLLSPALAK